MPAGFTAIAEQPVACFEVCDFYIVPYFRKNKLGRNFITALFAELGGSWQIKQVAGADYAVKFWREVIGYYTQQQFVEDTYLDSKWGRVTRQQFNHH